MNKLGLTMVILMLFRAALCAQETTMTAASPDVAVPYRDENDTAGASEIIFSNLTPSSGDLYNGDPDEALTIAGKSASGQTEEWFAVQFTPKVDARAKVLLAAVGYSYGSKRIKLGIYTNDRVTQSVGRLVHCILD